MALIRITQSVELPARIGESIFRTVITVLEQQLPQASNQSQSISRTLMERMMGRVYVAAFLLPSPVKKILTDFGWEFESPEHLPEQTIEALRSALGVRHTETYLGMDVWETDGVKATIVRDESGSIEEVSVQLYSRKPDDLRLALHAAGLDNIEVFVPGA